MPREECEGGVCPVWNVAVECALYGMWEWNVPRVECGSGVCPVWSVGVECALCGMWEWSVRETFAVGN